MENKFARLISYLFHPLLMTLYTFVILFNLNVYFASDITFNGKLIILSFVFISTFLFPALITYILYKKHLISSLHLEKREERKMPYVFTIIFYFGAYYMLKNTGISYLYLLLILATTLLIILVFLINLKFKISIHTMSVGALTGIIAGISFRFKIEMMPLILILVIISGLVAYSRLTLNAHRPSEVYSGYLLGLMSMLIMFILL